MSPASTAGGLAGIRVLELGEMVSAPYATKLMADLGADVIKVEPLGGERARTRGPFRDAPDANASGLYLALNTNKRTVIGEHVSAFQELLDQTDILVTNLRRPELDSLGIDLDELHHQRPDLVICAITPFGRTGPYADYRAEELTVSHAGGWAYQCPGASSEEDKPPLKVFGHQTDFQAGMAASMVALAAYDRAEQTGVGDLIDFSSMSHCAGMLEAALIAASYMGENPNRLGSRLLNPWRILPCSDGLIFLVCVEQDQWERLVTFMGDPEWTTMGLFDTLDLRLENEDLLVHYLAEWTATQNVDDLWHAGQSRRICFAPVLTMADMAAQPHLAEREFLLNVDHPAAGPVLHLGRPFTASSGLWRDLAPAPLLRKATDTSEPETFGSSRSVADTSATPRVRPLEGVRVLDFSWVWAGPYCTMHLAFLGAEVIKVESADRPGLGRRLPLHPPDIEPTLNTSAYFNQWDQGKLSCELDLSSPAAIDTIKELVVGCDVVVENFATGVMERLGLGFDVLREINPQLVMASISGYGSTGPLKDYMGYGPTTGPLSGLTSLTGYAGGEPRELGIAAGDPSAGITAAFAITAALVARRASNAGSYLDVALWEATAVNAVEGWMAHALGNKQPERMGNRDPLMAPHGCYPTLGDDQWISIACASDEEWVALATLLGSEVASDPRFGTAGQRKASEDELDELLAGRTNTFDCWELTRELQAAGVAAFPSMSPLALLSDPHLEARQFFQQLDHPEVGIRTHTGPAWLASNSLTAVARPAPLLGQHTTQILRPE